MNKELTPLTELPKVGEMVTYRNRKSKMIYGTGNVIKSSESAIGIMGRGYTIVEGLRDRVFELCK